jgi:hypothetical protein
VNLSLSFVIFSFVMAVITSDSDPFTPLDSSAVALVACN